MGIYTHIQLTVKEAFQKWMVRICNLAPSTVQAYSSAIDSITGHYRKHAVDRMADLYDIRQFYDAQAQTLNLRELRRIRDAYDTTGRFAGFGHIGHGTVRAAIKKYYVFCTASENRAIFLNILHNCTSVSGNTVQRKPRKSIPVDQAKIILANACKEMEAVAQKYMTMLDETDW